MTFPPNRYSDDDQTCAATYATLRILHEDADPGDVTRALGIEPSDHWRAGESVRYREGEMSETRRPNPRTRWTLTSDEQTDSRDALRHIDWVLDLLDDKDAELTSLKEAGWWLVMVVYWESVHGDDGPRITPRTMHRLAEIGAFLWFDVYYPWDEPPRVRRAIERHNARVTAGSPTAPDEF